jgi:hypothetical protein
VKGNEAAPAETNKILAFHGSGRLTYKRVLPPVRNQAVISIDVLCPLLARIVPQNVVSCLQDGIVINGNIIKIGEGVCTVGATKFRFKDLWGLLESLIHERMLDADGTDIRNIRLEYYKTLNDE